MSSAPTTKHYRACNLCEAICGIEIEHSGHQIVAIRGDGEDPFSHVHICPKAVALEDIQNDPDRVMPGVVSLPHGWGHDHEGTRLATDPPAALILFVPFLAAGLKLLYLKTGTLYLDHLIFSLHFQSALFFVLAASLLVAWVTWTLDLGLGPSVFIPAGTALLMLTADLGRALHRVHPQTLWRTVVRTFLLTAIYASLLRYAFAVAYLAAVWKM